MSLQPILAARQEIQEATMKEIERLIPQMLDFSSIRAAIRVIKGVPINQPTIAAIE